MLVTFACVLVFFGDALEDIEPGLRGFAKKVKQERMS